MSPEEEVLDKIKFFIECKNEAAAIRVIEQYGYWKENKMEL